MLRRAAIAVGLAASMILIPTAASAGLGEGDGSDTTPAVPEVSAGASGGALQVEVSQSGSTSSGRTFSSTTTRSVDPLCWYGRGLSGHDYYEYWKPGGPARQSATLDAYAAQGLLNKGWEDYATITDGYWYEATCSSTAPGAYVVDYFLAHPAVWVPAGTTAPVETADVDPAVLAQIASEAMDLPTGTIAWNPDLDGTGATTITVPTWVWITEAPTTVSVRATIASGTWAQVDATLTALDLSAPGADPTTCPDTGTPWTPQATTTTCQITFYRSSANQPVKTGQTLPTATLTATATWTASWTSSQNPTPTTLPTQTQTTTAEIPVTEIQTLVTNR